MRFDEAPQLTLTRFIIEIRCDRADDPQREMRRAGCRGRARRRREGATTVAVQMELTRIIISENNEQQIIFLKEVDGERTFPIVIGIFEATSIDRRVKNLPAPAR